MKMQGREVPGINSYKAFFDNSDDFLFILDTHGNILAANNAVQTTLGYTLKELIGRNLTTLHPEKEQEEVSALLEVSAEKKKGNHRFSLTTKRQHDVLVEISVFSGEWENKEAVFAVYKDLWQLRQSEMEYFEAFHGSAVSMALSTIEDGRFVEVNEGFLKLLGYKKEDVVGKTPNELRLWVDEVDRVKLLEAMKTKGSVRNVEARVRGRDGAVRYGMFSAHLIHFRGAP
ncbi:MAG: PAS domain S-box protein, partial [bacterium]|nr:PAS domain S-box protein [bacterium]